MCDNECYFMEFFYCENEGNYFLENLATWMNLWEENFFKCDLIENYFLKYFIFLVFVFKKGYLLY